MEVTETRSDGLSREFRVLIPASDLDTRLTEKLEGMKDQVHLKGFRPGKAPVSFLKKTYGKSLMGEIVQQAVNEGSRQALDERELRPAREPKLDFEQEMEDVISGKADLAFTMSVEVMPEFELADMSGLKVERPVAEVEDEDVDDALKRLAEQNQSYSPKPEGEAAAEGDRLTIDFKGDIGGEPFEGGAAEDQHLVLGSGQFIPGFEDQLMGAKAGEERDVNITFPEDYGAKELAGKEAHFAVTVKEVAAPDEISIDDDLATRMGFENLAQLKDAVRGRLKEDFAARSRVHLKRAILDALDEAHDFELPPGMVDSEFEQIWHQVEHEMEHHGRSAEDENKTVDELKDEYRKIAERRVRLGLVLAEVGQRNNITVSQEELGREIGKRTRMFPGQEQQVYEYYARNPAALAELRAPLYEEKTVDFISELATVTDKPVDKETLFSDPDEEKG
ncbi:MAG: trigger factor [Alphaproteobacteria bacterium]